MAFARRGTPGPYTPPTLPPLPPQPDNEDAQEILAILKPAHMEILEQRTKLLAACRALVQELKCYTEVNTDALTLAAEAMRGLS